MFWNTLLPHEMDLRIVSIGLHVLGVCRSVSARSAALRSEAVRRITIN